MEARRLSGHHSAMDGKDPRDWQSHKGLVRLWASRVMPAATEAAAPPLDPPGVCSADHGFQVRSRRWLSVLTTVFTAPIARAEPSTESSSSSPARKLPRSIWMQANPNWAST